MKEKNRKYKKAVLLVVIFCVFAGATAWGTYHYSTQKTENEKFIEDALAEDGKLKSGVDKKRLDQVIQDETDKSKFEFGINTKPEFEDCFSKGPLCIENPSNNPYDMQVQIKRNDTGEEIYKTASIKPGYGVESGKLSAQLKKGVYPCTAIIQAVSEKSVKGEIQVPVTIDIKN